MDCTTCELGPTLTDIDQAHFCGWCRNEPPKQLCLAIQLGEDRYHPFLTASDEAMVRTHRAALLSNDVDSSLFKWNPQHRGFINLPSV